MHAITPPSSLKRSLSGDSHGTQFSTSSSQRALLFGEIPSSTSTEDRASRSDGSICTLVRTTSAAFLRFWLAVPCRDRFLAHVPTDDLLRLRLVCHDFSERTAPALFAHLAVTFRPSTFTKPARLKALRRIGPHVRDFTFHMPHSPETFLPPLIDPTTGEELPFRYEPQTETPRSAVGKQPKYGSWEMTDLVVRQYPPLFHAATNVPSFIAAFTSLPALTALTISCPSHDPTTDVSRRSTVDYALISLCIALERASPPGLVRLALAPIHPTGLHYLHPTASLGASARSPRTWSRIEHLTLRTPSPHPSASTEPLRLLHAYLHAFSPHLTTLDFTWLDPEPPHHHHHPIIRQDSAVSLPPSPHHHHHQHPAIPPPVPPKSPRHAPSTTHRTPTAPFPFPPSPSGPPFPALQRIRIQHALLDGPTVAAFIRRYEGRVGWELLLVDCACVDGGLEDLLADQARRRRRRRRRRKDGGGREEVEAEVMEVPIMMAPSCADDSLAGHARMRARAPAAAAAAAGGKGLVVEGLLGGEDELGAARRTRRGGWWRKVGSPRVKGGAGWGSVAAAAVVAAGRCGEEDCFAVTAAAAAAAAAVAAAAESADMGADVMGRERCERGKGRWTKGWWWRCG